MGPAALVPVAGVRRRGATRGGPGRRAVRVDGLPVVHRGRAAGCAAGAVRLGWANRGRDQNVHRDEAGSRGGQVRRAEE